VVHGKIDSNVGSFVVVDLAYPKKLPKQKLTATDGGLVLKAILPK